MKGIIIGLCAFFIIGIFHPIVIKAEYYFSKNIFPLFIAAGILCLALCFIVTNDYFQPVLGILGFSFLWSVKELFEQEERVKKGWFPANPNRKK